MEDRHARSLGDQRGCSSENGRLSAVGACRDSRRASWRLLRHLVLLMSLSMTAVAFLMVGLGAYSLGDSIRRGNIANARGIASCVYVVDGLASVSNRQPLIMVGSASGPSLLISPAGDSTLVSDGLTVRPVSPAQSPEACAPRARWGRGGSMVEQGSTEPKNRENKKRADHRAAQRPEQFQRGNGDGCRDVS